MITNRTRRSIVSAAFALMFTAGLAIVARAQQAQEGVAGRVGDALDNTGRAIKRGVQGAVMRTQARVNTLEVLDRVVTRLHWDRALVAADLEVEGQPGGVMVLRGVVPDAKAKTKAVTLARDTVGVVQVVDEISVVPPSAVDAPAPVVQPVPAPERRTP